MIFCFRTVLHYRAQSWELKPDIL